MARKRISTTSDVESVARSPRVINVCLTEGISLDSSVAVDHAVWASALFRRTLRAIGEVPADGVDLSAVEGDRKALDAGLAAISRIADRGLQETMLVALTSALSLGFCHLSAPDALKTFAAQIRGTAAAKARLSKKEKNKWTEVDKIRQFIWAMTDEIWVNDPSLIRKLRLTSIKIIPFLLVEFPMLSGPASIWTRAEESEVARKEHLIVNVENHIKSFANYHVARFPKRKRSRKPKVA